MHTIGRPAGDRAERVGVPRRGSTTRRAGPPTLLQLYTLPPSTYPTEPGAPYGAGHCNFTTEQFVGAVRALDGWASSGSRPGDAELAKLFAPQPGALDLDYKPARWPAR